MTTTGTGAERIPGAVAVLGAGIREGLHLGAQVYVSVDGVQVADFAIGEARPGVPMTTESMVIWWSMTKPTVAVSMAQLWERGRLDLDDRIADYVPEFGVKGKDVVTIRHALTHMGGFRSADRVTGTFDEMVAAVCDAPLEPNWIPGETAGYHLTAGMTILGEVIRRIDGRSFDRYVREEVFEPLGMHDCWVGMPEDRYEGYRERLGTMFRTSTQPPEPIDRLDSLNALTRCSPGAGGRGPMNQLRRLYEALLLGGELDGVRVLSPQTVEAITSPHRVGVFDKTFRIVNQWALGFGVDSYQMGSRCSRRAYGHGGSRSAQAMTDPEHRLVAIAQCNGMCEPEPHQDRFAHFFDALYEDLGIGSTPREKEPAKYA